MYYIYHIPKVKVGCTSNLINRVEKQQGYSKKEYTILARTKDKDKASHLEIYWQNALGYKKDNKPYNKLITMKVKSVNNSITFGDKGCTILNACKELKNLESIEIFNKSYVLDDYMRNWIESNINESQYNYGPFVYLNAFRKAYKEHNETKVSNDNIFTNIRSWAKERGLYDKGDSITQYVKLQEEAGELAKALLKVDKDEIVDAIGDIVVVLTNLAEHCNIEGGIEYCIDSAYNEIKDRKGKMINGTFVKEQ